MKIGIVSATYSPSRNGVATSTGLFVRGLKAQGHEVRVFAPDHPEAEPQAGVYRLPSTTLGAPKDYPVLLPAAPQLSARLPIADLDIVHTMHPFVAGRVAFLWSRRLRIPLVFTAHTQYHSYVHYAPTPARLTRWAIRQHVRMYAAQADLVLAPGQAMVKTLRDYGYSGEVSVLPNPVDREVFKDLDALWVRRKFDIAESAPLLVYVGRLAAEKNLAMLIEAFAETLGARPESRLLIVGDGPLRASLESQAGALPVLFAGAVGHEEVPYYLKAADLFVTASTTEVLPMTFLESLAAGTPIVAASSAAARELIDEGVNGHTSAPKAADLSRTTLSTLSPEHLARLQAGALRSAERYDVVEVTSSLIGLYKEALEAKALAVAS